jgi:DNA-binding NarL/FixJ family response regulator
MSRTRVLLADPNAVVLEMLTGILQPECEVVDRVQNGVSLLEKVRELNPDVVVLEVGMGDMTGFDVLRRLQAGGCTIPCVFVSLYEGVDFIETSLKMGASAYVLKASASLELPAAVRRAVRQNALPQVNMTQ